MDEEAFCFVSFLTWWFLNCLVVGVVVLWKFGEDFLLKL